MPKFFNPLAQRQQKDPETNKVVSIADLLLRQGAEEVLHLRKDGGIVNVFYDKKTGERTEGKDPFLWVDDQGYLYFDVDGEDVPYLERHERRDEDENIRQDYIKEITSGKKCCTALMCERGPLVVKKNILKEYFDNLTVPLRMFSHVWVATHDPSAEKPTEQVHCGYKVKEKSNGSTENDTTVIPFLTYAKSFYTATAARLEKLDTFNRDSKETTREEEITTARIVSENINDAQQLVEDALREAEDGGITEESESLKKAVAVGGVWEKFVNLLSKKEVPEEIQAVEGTQNAGDQLNVWEGFVNSFFGAELRLAETGHMQDVLPLNLAAGASITKKQKALLEVDVHVDRALARAGELFYRIAPTYPSPYQNNSKLKRRQCVFYSTNALEDIGVDYRSYLPRELREAFEKIDEPDKIIDFVKSYILRPFRPKTITDAINYMLEQKSGFLVQEFETGLGPVTLYRTPGEPGERVLFIEAGQCETDHLGKILQALHDDCGLTITGDDIELSARNGKPALQLNQPVPANEPISITEDISTKAEQGRLQTITGVLARIFQKRQEEEKQEQCSAIVLRRDPTDMYNGSDR